MDPQRPQVVAHRGSSAAFPEHTLAAYVHAIEDGADALECDVRLTADGHLVLVHDRTIDRTSDGRGVVSTMTLEELRAVDFGSWRTDLADVPAVRHDERAHRVGTLEELLELVADAGREVGLAIETKHPVRYGGRVEHRLVELLGRFGLARPRYDGDLRVRVMSFSRLSVRRMRDLAPGLPTVLLMGSVPARFRDGSLPYGARIAGPGISVLRGDPDYVARVHARGNAVHVWTVDEPADVDLCLRLGVDAIISNRPGETLARVDGAAR